MGFLHAPMIYHHYQHSTPAVLKQAGDKVLENDGEAPGAPDHRTVAERLRSWSRWRAEALGRRPSARLALRRAASPAAARTQLPQTDLSSYFAHWKQLTH